MDFSIILACTLQGGIGFKNTLPWKIKEDMQHFKNITSRSEQPDLMNAVIMGRKTWESIPKKFRPLDKRINVVLSRNPEFFPDNEQVLVYGSLDEALEALVNNKKVGKVFITGGSTLYDEALLSPRCKSVYLTTVISHFECDTFLTNFFETLDKHFFNPGPQMDTLEENGVQFDFLHLMRKPQSD